MSIILFADNASTVLASGIASSDTTLTVQAGTGALFSAPGSGQIAYGTLEDVSGNIEVVQITNRTIDSFVIVRGQDGTTPQSFASGTRFEQRLTAGILNAFLQKTGGDVLSGTTTVTGVLNLGSGGSIQNGEIAGTAVRSQPGDTSNQILVPVGSPATAAGSVILTASNFTTNLPSGIGVTQSGMILLWYGSSTSIPSGYVLCDGTNGTPDLRDNFVVGGGGALPTTGGSNTGTTGSNGITGTTDSYTLQLTDIPSHQHVGLTADSTVNTGSIGTYWVITNNTSGGFVAQRTMSNSSTGYAGGGGAHAHTLSTTNTAHVHTVDLPPYVAVFYIMKT